jgi:hypothetical protein
LLHYLTFVLFITAMYHGILAGTDSGSRGVLASYFVSGTVVLFLTFYRILALRSPQKKALARIDATATRTPAV